MESSKLRILGFERQILGTNSEVKPKGQFRHDVNAKEFLGVLLFSTLPIRREVTEFFYQSDVKEASGMLNIPFGLALSDTLDLIEEAFSKKKSIISVSF